MAKFLSDSASGTVSVVARLHNTGKEALKGPLVACVTLLTTSVAEGVLAANSDNSQAGVGAEWLFAADAGLRPGERTEPKRFAFQLRGTPDFIPDKMKPNGFVDLGLQVLASGHPIKRAVPFCFILFQRLSSLPCLWYRGVGNGSAAFSSSRWGSSMWCGPGAEVAGQRMRSYPDLCC